MTEIARSRLAVVGIWILIVTAIAPTLIVKIPAMEDYLDHLSRMYILTTTGTHNANPYYQVSWALYPDIAMDLIIPQLAKVMQVETAVKIFFLASQLLIISGAFALELSVKRRHEFSVFAALMTIYSMPFSFGFINFEFGTGVAMWGISSWIALSRIGKWGCQFIIHAIFSSALFLAHFFALGIYGLTIGIFELRRLLESQINAKRALTIVFILVCPVAIMLLLMLLSGATIGEGQDNVWWFSAKPIWLVLFLNGYDATLAASSFCALMVLLISGAIRRNLLCTVDGRWIAVGFLILFIAMPFKLAGSRMADIRMITAAFLILPAFASFASKQRSVGNLATVIGAVIILVNSSYVGYVWLTYQNDYQAIKASFALLREKSTILVATSPVRDNSSTILTNAPMWRAPTLAVYYANAFVSSLYTLPGTHAVRVRPEWQHLALNGRTETYEPPSLADLKSVAEGKSVPGTPHYVRNWRSDFDYVYLLGPHAPNALPNMLYEIFTSRRFTLYRVQKSFFPNLSQ